MGYLDNIEKLKKVYNKKIKENYNYLINHDICANTDYYKEIEQEMIFLKKIVKDLNEIINSLY